MRSVLQTRTKLELEIILGFDSCYSSLPSIINISTISIGCHKKSETVIKITRYCEDSSRHSANIPSKNIGKL